MLVNDQVVMLIHGLGGSRLDMWPLARRLKSHGFDVINWGYPSFGKSIEPLADRLLNELRRIQADPSVDQFHLVTHSMGSIIARSALQQLFPHQLKRMVMLAPPSRGSHMARKLAPWFGWLLPCLDQLSDAPDSFVNRLPGRLSSENVEFGIIDAARDRVIAPGFTALSGCLEQTVVCGQHAILPWYRDTIRLVETFLLHGSFCPAHVPQSV